MMLGFGVLLMVLFCILFLAGVLMAPPGRRERRYLRPNTAVDIAGVFVLGAAALSGGLTLILLGA